MFRTTLTAVVAAAGVSLFAGAPHANTIPERLMVDLSRDFRLKDFQAAGVVGNLARETGNFRFMQELRPIVEGSRGGIGYSQWTGSRRLSFEDYAGSVQNQLTYKVNYGYLKKELTDEYAHVIDEVRRSKNLWEATVIFMRGYLKPQKNPNNIRISMNYAGAYLRGDYEGSGCQSHHDVTIDGRRMMIAACPETTIQVDGHDVGVVLAVSERPRRRPDLSTPIRMAEAGDHMSRRPAPRPAPDVTDAPKSVRPKADAVRDVIMVAMVAVAAREVILPIPDIGEDDPGDPFINWQTIHARKEDDFEVHAPHGGDQASHSMFG